MDLGQPECRSCKAGKAVGGGEADHGLDQLGDDARHYHRLHHLRCLPLVLEPGVIGNKSERVKVR